MAGRQTAGIEPHRFKPGQSGNPGGRPKRLPVTDFLREQLDKPIPESMQNIVPPEMAEVFGGNPTFGQLAAFKLISLSIAKGDVLAFKEMMDRAEGKVTQTTVLLERPVEELTDEELDAELIETRKNADE